MQVGLWRYKNSNHIYCKPMYMVSGLGHSKERKETYICYDEMCHLFTIAKKKGTVRTCDK